ncbi:putative MFS family arabinose efflux permease [Nonlabens dokdonensis]|uniref:Major facilitator superfamily MFS_1 n=2 Tax=Nonlabens dokdonensis TaxID=328515 RepID=L7WC97_NONDD|nr:MFS transporter [Nonlabens dokdonensis]AGC77812.1 major facilitator superfamily MFS_1 [Nonlabens dokdonensis DSW-6]PZX39655.1 putative MFS family arabinose efflux permease [Nonlabens dokdonensis]
MKSNQFILLIIVVAQFCCTSLWFAGNGVIDDLIIAFQLSEDALPHVTAAVQFGFIIGTFVFALLSIVDRFSPSKVFFISAMFAAIFNLAVLYTGNNFTSILSFRFLTGFFLAGIYPVGMKIAADYFDKGLGKSLGFLVGALVLGTAFPHLLKDIISRDQWELVIIATSILAFLGGLLMNLVVKDGPYRKASQGIQFNAFLKVFKKKNFRAAAFGYFGHMWELYTFWAFVPFILKSYDQLHPQANFDIPSLSFLVIAIGGLACVLGGYISQHKGVKKTAFIALALSGLCCVALPFLIQMNLPILFVMFMLFWGMMVIADSPLLSTLVAQNAPSEIKGTALTIVNGIGFSITIISIQIIGILLNVTPSYYVYAILAIGPVLGLIALRNRKI